MSFNRSVEKLEQDVNTIKKNFHSINTQLAQLKEINSDILDSDTEEDSHFQHAESNVSRHSFQFAQLDDEFEPRISQLFKQSSDRIDSTQLYLREIILLDSQLTMDIFFYLSLVENINKSKSIMRLRINGGTMIASHKAKVPG